MSKKGKRKDKGDAISMEDALSMLVVIFVLFVVFLVPLVSMEKPPQLTQVPLDPFWAKVSRSFDEVDPKASPYSQNFGLHYIAGSRVQVKEENVVVEFLTQDSSVMVIDHDLKTSNFVSLFVPAGGKSIIYNTGTLGWDSIEAEWKIISKQVEYYPTEVTEKTEYNYKSWFRKL